MNEKKDNWIEEAIAVLRKHPDFEDYYGFNEDVITIIKYYYFNVLGWCGCGNPEKAIETIGKYLKYCTIEEIEERKEYCKKEFGNERNYDIPLLMCLAYALDAAEFTDHGSGIGWCWLTDSGRYFLWAIEDATKQEILDI